MKIVKIGPSDRYRNQQFIDLPYKIYKNTPQWVPPLEIDNKRIFDRNKNPFYKHSEAAFFLALSADGASIGRVAFLNNRHYNDFNHERTAFFYLFECTQDSEAAKRLFTAGFEWAKQHGLDKVIGLRGFSTLDGLGLLVRGFEHRPALGITYNLEYYPELIESAGFSVQSDIVSGYLAGDALIPKKIHQISELVKKRRGLSITQYKSRRDLRPLISQLKGLFNGMMEGTSGNIPPTDEEAKAIANQLLWLCDPRLVKVIMKDDTPVGFLMAYPDISAALQSSKGKLFPFGWLKLWREKQRTEWVNINGAGILEDYRGLGGTAILFSEMEKSIHAGKYKHAEIVQIGVDNDRMQRELSEIGIDFYKTHRLYEYSLSP
jgi:hypothetical protein